MDNMLSVGDLVEVGPLIGGLSNEQVTLQVVEEKPEGAGVVFEATIFGIKLGTLDVLVNASGDVIGGEFHE